MNEFHLEFGKISKYLFKIFILVRMESPCPDSWNYIPLSGSCYGSLDRWSQYTWNEAKKKCQDMQFQYSSNLLYFDEDSEYDIIYNEYWIHKSIIGYYWLGGFARQG